MQSLGAGILYFLTQVGLLSWYAFDQCCEVSNSNLQDCIWYVYKQVPSTLPMAAVVAFGVMVFAQILERFAEEIRPLVEMRYWGLKDWASVIVVVVFFILVVVALIFFSDEIPIPVTLAVVAFVLVQPWLAWVKKVAGVDRNSAGGDVGTRD